MVVNQFEADDPAGGKRDRALECADDLAEADSQEDLLEMIARTPESCLTSNQGLE